MPLGVVATEPDLEQLAADIAQMRDSRPELAEELIENPATLGGFFPQFIDIPPEATDIAAGFLSTASCSAAYWP